MDKLPAQLLYKKVCETSGVLYFDNDLRPFLEEVLKELCSSNSHLASQIRINHFDRAIFKFRQAKEKTFIRNTKQYFKACIVSAILETAFDELEPTEKQ